MTLPRPRPGGLRGVLAAGSLAVVVGLSACTSGAPGLPGEPADPPTAGRSLVREAADAAVRRRVDVVADTWSRVDEHRRVLVQLPEFSRSPRPGVVSAQYKPYVEHFLADQAGRPVPGPQEPAPTLTIRWHAAVVSDAVMGIVVSTEEFAGANGTSDERMHWVDRRTGALVGWRELIRDDRRPAFEREVRAALRDTRGVDEAALSQVFADRADEGRRPADRTTAAGLEPSIVFDLDGSVFVLFPPGAIAAQSAGRLVARIPTDQAADLVSDIGRAARDAALADDGRGSRASGSSSSTPAAASPEPDPGRSTDCARARCVTLTFDDGPVPETERLLDILERRRVTATFFMIGASVVHYPDVARRVVTSGHEVGVHGWGHEQFATMAPDAVHREIERTADAITQVTGTQARYLRPPFGVHDASSDKQAAASGLPVVLWDVDSLDWKDGDERAIRQEVLRHVRPGSVVMMHDILPTTASAVPGVIDDLRRAGYTIVPLRDILSDPRPGAVARPVPPAR